jgi:acyl-coenzyme A thioesterase PaaI-like protein
VGTVLKAGRTLTVCRLEVFGVQDEHRSLVATGQQTLMCVKERPEQPENHPSSRPATLT